MHKKSHPHAYTHMHNGYMHIYSYTNAHTYIIESKYVHPIKEELIVSQSFSEFSFSLIHLPFC